MRKNAHRLYPEHRAMTLPLSRAKRKECYDSDPDFDFDFAAEIIPPCALIPIGVEIEIAIGIVTLTFSSLAAPRGSRCLSAAGKRKILREAYVAGLS